MSGGVVSRAPKQSKHNLVHQHHNVIVIARRLR